MLNHAAPGHARQIPPTHGYANPTGGITFVNTARGLPRFFPSDHTLRLGNEAHAAWDAHLAFVHPDDPQKARVWSDMLKTGSAGGE